MTYQEALEHKKTVTTPFIKNGQEYKIMVVPDIEKDFLEYLSYIRAIRDILEDKHSIKYSTNAEFKVRALCFVRWDVLWLDI